MLKDNPYLTHIRGEERFSVFSLERVKKPFHIPWTHNHADQFYSEKLRSLIDSMVAFVCFTFIIPFILLLLLYTQEPSARPSVEKLLSDPFLLSTATPLKEDAVSELQQEVERLRREVEEQKRRADEEQRKREEAEKGREEEKKKREAAERALEEIKRS